MKQPEKIPIFNNLWELYQNESISVDPLDLSTAFTVHNLKETHLTLPHVTPTFRINFFSFTFAKDGQGQYTSDEQTFKITPGTIYFTNPGHFRSFEWYSINDVFLITLSESFLKENVHADVFDEFPFLLAETVPPRVVTPAQFAEFEQLYDQIRHTYHGNSPYRNRIIGNLFVVLLLKIKEYFWEDYNPIYEGNRSSQIVKNFKRMLEQHYRQLSQGKADKVFRVQDYADAQSLHPNYLNNVIKSKTGKAVGTWITEKTIAEAKSQLQHSSASIKELAFLLGFTESTHFSNYFKKHTGLSPIQFRKQ